jgi:hypothetical protein
MRACNHIKLDLALIPRKYKVMVLMARTVTQNGDLHRLWKGEARNRWK